MARADWTNQIWYAFLDPTGVLDASGEEGGVSYSGTTRGPVLKAMAPVSAEWTDILKYEVNSSPQQVWSKNDYRLYVDYAWQAGRNIPYPCQDDEFNFYVRASGTTSSGSNYTVTDGYKATIKAGTTTNKQATVTLYRRVSGSDTSLATTTIAEATDTIIKTGVKNSIALEVSGPAQNVVVNFYYNSQTILSFTDTDATSIASGAPGIGVKSGGHVNGGGVYVDNFRIRELTIPQGNEDWIPSNLSNLSLWTKASSGTRRNLDEKVNQWIDLSGNSNTLSQITLAQQPTYTLGQVNSFPSLAFATASSSNMTAADSSTLDMSTAMTVFAVIKVDSFGTNVGQYYYSPLFGKGTNYKMGFRHTAATGTTGEIYFDDGSTISASSGANISTSAATYTQVAIVSADNSNNTGAFYKDGTSYGACAATPSTNGANTTVLSLGTDANSYMSSKVAELIIFSEQLTTADRQKVEGYLAWRYNLEAQLPQNHPYKSAPPS